jgi:hypothetical protein
MPARSWAERLLKWLLVLMGTVIVAVALYFVVALNFSYSTGERAGYVQRFSKSGWVCKTWEGEIVMVTLPGAMPERFPFSVRDEAVARQVSETMGDHVVLTYEQHMGLPSCFAETSYFVTGVRKKDGAVLPPPPAPATPPQPPAQ